MTALAISRGEVEDLLYLEADLLDSWKLKEWLALFTADARYFVPSASLEDGASSDRSLFYIADDRQMMEERVGRLYKRNAFAEIPRSKTRHIYSNIRLLDSPDPQKISAQCYFSTHRSRGRVHQTFFGVSRYTILREDKSLRICEKFCKIDTDDLHELGRISIIL